MTRALRLAAACLLAVIAAAGCAPRNFNLEDVALESGRAQLTIRASRSKSLTPLEHSFDAMRSEVGDSPSLDAGPLADSGPPRERSKVTRHFAGDYYQYWFECLDAVLDLEQRIEYPH